MFSTKKIAFPALILTALFIGGFYFFLAHTIQTQAQGSSPVVQSGWTSNAVGSSSSLTLTKPSGVAVDDLLIIIVGNDDNSNTAQWNNTTNKPTGFTLINEAGTNSSDAHTAAFYRVADGTEGATINVPAASGDDYWGFYVRVTGADASSPIDVIGADVIFGTGTSSHAITGVTTSVNDTLAFYLLAFDGGDGDPFSVSGTGWTENAEIEAGTGSGNASGTWGTKEMASSGATGTATVTSNAGDGSGSFQFAVRGAAGGGNNPPTISPPVTDNGPVTEGSSIDFTVNWADTDGDSTRAILCRTSAFTAGAFPACPGGSYGGASGLNPPPSTIINYPTTGADIGTPSYWAHVCDPSGDCAVTTGSFTVDAAGSGSTDSRVAASSDDAEEDEGPCPCSVNIDSSDLELVLDGSSGNQTVGMRFQNMNIPVGATITNAYIVFTAKTADSVATDLVFRGEYTGNAATFTFTEDDSISTRIQTGDSVPWNSIPAWTADELHPTPDLSLIIQEIVDHLSWSSGNAMVIIVTGTGERTAKSYDHADIDVAPILYVDFTTGAPNNPPTISPPVTDNGPVTEGSSIDFTVNWADTDGDSTRAILCRTSAFTAGAFPACPGGSYGGASGLNPPPSTIINYPTTGADIGTPSYWAHVCDPSGDCSNVPTGTFTVNALPPTINTNTESGVTDSAAILNGTVSGTGSVTAYFRHSSANPGSCDDSVVQWGIKTANQIFPDPSSQAFSQAISGLSASTPYYYCAFASNAGGPSYGDPRLTFTTTPPAPTVNLDGYSTDAPNFKDGPISISSDNSVTLQWSSTDTDDNDCTASGGWSGIKTASGTETIFNITVDTTFTLTCNNGIGIGNDFFEARVLSIASFVAENPSGGPEPLNNVDLTVDMVGTIAGVDFNYRFDCVDGTGDDWTEISFSDPYTKADLCNYATDGSYTARVIVDHSEGSVTDTVVVTVSNVNNFPTISSVSDPPDPVSEDANVTFTVYWDDTDGDSVRAIICKTNLVSGGASPSCPGSVWSPASALDATSPTALTYIAQNDDIATSPNTYWAFVCDDPSGDCSAGTSGSFSVEAAPTWGVNRDIAPPDPDELQNWAWGDRVVGWISFNCADEDMVCPTSDFAVVMEQFSSPPSVSGFSDSYAFYCLAEHQFSWVYSDVDGNPQEYYQLQIDTTSNFSSIPLAFDSGKILSPTDQRNAVVSISPDTDQLAFNTTYFWRVKVWDDTGAESIWIDALTTAETALHPYPQPDFSWDPSRPSQDETVFFTDETIFFTAIINQAWDWTIPSMPDAEFVDGASNITQDPHVQFHTEGSTIDVMLTAIDLELDADPNSGSGRCSITDNNAVPPGLNIQLPLPEFREIPPVSFWGHMMAFLSGIRNIFT